MTEVLAAALVGMSCAAASQALIYGLWTRRRLDRMQGSLDAIRNLVVLAGRRAGVFADGSEEAGAGAGETRHGTVGELRRILAEADRAMRREGEGEG